MKKTTLNLVKTTKNKAAKITVLLFLLSCYAQAKSICQNSAKQFTIETNRIWINVTDTNGAFSQTLMGYRAGATNGVDNGLDGAYMNNGSIALTSLINGARYAIQFKGLPFSITDVVPLSFSASYNGSYTFAIDHMDGFFNDPNFNVCIHDKLTDTYNNLKTGPYTFSATTGIVNDRFELTYSQTLGTSTSTFTAANLDVYQNNGNLVINTEAIPLKNITIYSITGQLLFENNQVNASQFSFCTNTLGRQPIIIKVTTQDGITVAKKWLYL